MRCIRLAVAIPLILLLLPSLEAGALDLRVFSDITFVRSTADSENREENGAFAVGEFDLFMTSLIRDRIQVLSEIVVEQNLEGGSFIDLERLTVGYIFDDAVSIHVGRFHNALGYWNTTFHHGFLFQTSIHRPLFLAFEHDGGVLPIHVVGVKLSGSPVTQPVKIDYDLLAGNGSHIEPNGGDCCRLRPENVTDPNKDKAVSGNVTLWPTFLPGLGLGGFGFHGTVLAFPGSHLTTDPIGEIEQTIVGGHLVFVPHRGNSPMPEFLSEYFLILNEDVFSDTGTFRGTAYYIQMGYPVTQRFFPYVRTEAFHLDSDDPYFALLGLDEFTIQILGLRFSQNPQSAIKAEVHWVDEESLDRYLRFAAQWAFAF